MSANPFAAEIAARLYAAGRPDYSGFAMGIVRRLTDVYEPVRRAIDVGCGTGISTSALSPLAETVIGLEPSPAMLEQAKPMSNVVYRVGTAERIPLPDGSCDLIAVGSALHWFDQDRFLSEATRIAREGAALVVLDHWFTGQMEEHTRFSEWIRDVYLATYPSPSSNRSWRPAADLGEWLHTGWERYEHTVTFSADQLVSYLMTQSNLQTAMAEGDQTEQELRNWLLTETAPFFGDLMTGSFPFGGMVACHRQSTRGDRS